MKRIISILLIFTVNLLFLTHALLPHHHHDGVPHFTFFTEEHQHESDDTCCCPSSTPVSVPCDDECALDQDIDVICANNDEDNCHCAVCCVSHHHDTYDLLQALLSFYHCNFSLPDKTQEVRQPIYLTNYHHSYIAQALGMRAPPIV